MIYSIDMLKCWCCRVLDCILDHNSLIISYFSCGTSLARCAIDSCNCLKFVKARLAIGMFAFMQYILCIHTAVHWTLSAHLVFQSQGGFGAVFPNTVTWPSIISLDNIIACEVGLVINWYEGLYIAMFANGGCFLSLLRWWWCDGIILGGRFALNCIDKKKGWVRSSACMKRDYFTHNYLPSLWNWT